MAKKHQDGKAAGTLHDRLIEALREEFGRLPVGSRIPSGRELCSRFGVAYMTINHALDALVERGEIVRHRGRGSFTARSQVRVIYFLVPHRDLRHVDTTVLSGAIRQAYDLGVRLQTVTFSPDNTMLNVDFRALEEIPKHSAVIVPSSWFYNGFEFLSRRHCRVLYIDQYAEEGGQVPCGCSRVVFDREKQLFAAVRLLKEAGSHRIFLLTSNAHADDPVRSGFRKALQQEGFAYDERQMLFCDIRNYDSIFGRLNRLFLRGKFDYDAVLTQHSLQALAAYDVLSRHGVGVPEQCALLSLSERDILASRAVGITSLAYDDFELGRRAVRFLAEGVSSGCAEVPFQLTRRESVGNTAELNSFIKPRRR